MKPVRAILWDIDGTLIQMKSDEVFVPLQRAVAEVLVTNGLLGSVDEFRDRAEDYHGTTDAYIMQSYLRANGTPEEQMDELLSQSFVQVVVEFDKLAGQIKAEGRQLPGANRALRAAAHAGIVNGVVTGNVKGNAVAKLEIFDVRGIDFSVASFGNDSTNRPDLIPLALARLDEQLGYEVPRSQVAVIGDTRSDLNAAKVNGLTAVLVASANSDREALEALTADNGDRADAVLDSLTQMRQLMEALGHGQTADVILGGRGGIGV